MDGGVAAEDEKAAEAVDEVGPGKVVLVTGFPRRRCVDCSVMGEEE